MDHLVLDCIQLTTLYDRLENRHLDDMPAECLRSPLTTKTRAMGTPIGEMLITRKWYTPFIYYFVVYTVLEI